MLADAISAEALRFTRNRSAVFWSALFVPAAALLINVIMAVVTKINGDRMGDIAAELGVSGTDPVNLGASLLSSAGDLANPAVLLFVVIGAATLFASDYRWETWRLITGRNTRLNLMLGKLVVLAVLVAAAMLLLILAGLIDATVKAVTFGRPLAFSMDGEAFAAFAGLTALSWVRIMQFALIGLLMAVVSRSLLAALFTPLAVGAAQVIAVPVFMMMGHAPTGWTTLLALPNQAFDTIRNHLQDATGQAEGAAELLTRAGVGLALWLIVPAVLALWLFQRQDLSKE